MTMKNLNLTDVSATTSDSGCACCSTTDATEPTAQATANPTDVVSTYGVAGMTCGHCVGAVTDEIKALEGVNGVDVALVAGGTSTVTVTSVARLDDDQIAGAVTEAGYELTGRLS